MPGTSTAFPGGTIVLPIAYDSPNGAASNVVYSSSAGFAANGALVMQFTTPAVATAPTSGSGSIVLVEFSSAPAARTGSLSMTPCDFTGGIGGYGAFADDTGPTVNFTLDYKARGIHVELLPGTTYYFNVYNPLGCSPGPDCDVKITLTKQGGT